MLKKLLLSLIVIGSMQASEQHKEKLEFRFTLVDTQGRQHKIKPYFVSPLIHEIIQKVSPDKLQEAMNHLVINIVQLEKEDGTIDIGVKAHVKGLGGGPLSATPAAYAASGTVWASYAALCSAEGPVCAAHLPEFHAMAATAFTTTYWAVFFCPWLP